jgi:hypothetical protein
MNFAIEKNKTLLTPEREVELQHMKIVWGMIGYRWMRNKNLVQTVHFVRNNLSRTLCWCQHHLTGQFYSFCPLFSTNTACWHRERIKGLMYYLLWLISVITLKLGIPISTEAEIREFKARMDTLDFVSGFDNVAQQYWESQDLVGDILRVKRDQEKEAIIAEEIFRDLANILEEAYLLDPVLVKLAMKK